MSSLNLESYKFININSKDRTKFYEEIDAIVKIAQTFWGNTKMSWFPEHGVNHSKRILEIIDDIIGSMEVIKPELSREEIYALVAAVLLHDIGMQKLPNPQNQMLDEQYVGMRTNHPQTTYEIIMSEAKNWEGTGSICSDLYSREAVAKIARSHGTCFYKNSIEDFKINTVVVSGKKVRAKLLAALLLIADELDLKSVRVEHLIKENEHDIAPINAESYLHICRHYFIKYCKVVRDSHRFKVRLDMVLPNKVFSTELKRQLIESIIFKLCRQINMVREEFATHGIVWHNSIEVKCLGIPDEYTVALNKESVKVLEVETKENSVINWDAKIKYVKKFVQQETNIKGLIVAYPTDIWGKNFVKWCMKYSSLQTKVSGIFVRTAKKYSEDEFRRSILKINSGGLLIINNPLLIYKHNEQAYNYLIRLIRKYFRSGEGSSKASFIVFQELEEMKELDTLSSDFQASPLKLREPSFKSYYKYFNNKLGEDKDEALRLAHIACELGLNSSYTMASSLRLSKYECIE